MLYAKTLFGRFLRNCSLSEQSGTETLTSFVRWYNNGVNSCAQWKFSFLPSPCFLGICYFFWYFRIVSRKYFSIGCFISTFLIIFRPFHNFWHVSVQSTNFCPGCFYLLNKSDCFYVELLRCFGSLLNKFVSTLSRDKNYLLSNKSSLNKIRQKRNSKFHNFAVLGTRLEHFLEILWFFLFSSNVQKV